MSGTLPSVSRGVSGVLRSSLLRGEALLGGRWVGAVSGKTFPVLNPANGELIADVPDMGAEDTNIAIESAYSAQHKWAALTCKDRAARLRKWHDLIMSNKEELAQIVALEAGKVIQEARKEIAAAADYFAWFSEEAKRIDGDYLPPHTKGRKVIVAKQPVGVAALITPWNSPAITVSRKASAALAAGCSAVLKPSEETPLSALALAKLSQEAGIPPGVFNVVTSNRDSTPLVGAALTTSPLISALSFTGSTVVGKALARQCTDTVKKVSLELGGNAPLVVFNSANVEQAVAETIASKYRHTGQMCICPNRILVQRGIHDEYVEKLVSAVSKLVQGDPLNEDSQQGPLINESAVKKVESHVMDAVSKGAEVLVGGTRNEELGQLFFQPTVAIGTSSGMKVVHEETFGPLAAVTSFEDEEEAIAMANATPFGLAGYLFSTDVNQIWRVGEAIEVGMVGINETAILSEMIPLGGIKQSGLGLEGSKHGIEEYLNLKYLCFGGLEV